MKQRPAKPSSGFTLVELIMVLLVVGIVAAYAAVRGYSAAEVTLPSQAQKMATDLRHAQTLASTWGASLVVSAGAGGNVYSVSCKTASTTPPCNASPVIDPATGAAFSVTLAKNVGFSAVSNPALTFSSLGKPDAATTASYTLSSGTSTNTVTVEVITGKVTP